MTDIKGWIARFIAILFTMWFTKVDREDWMMYVLAVIGILFIWDTIGQRVKEILISYLKRS